MSALKGLRVVEIGQVLAGPYAAMLLGDLGADVVKIEAPGHGDHSRQMTPAISDETSAPFLTVNRNKRGISLNLKEAEGQRLLHQLVEDADIVIENYRPGVSGRLGFDYETLSRINPKLIYCSISGFGQTGPYSSRGGFDLIAQGMSGIMSLTGLPNVDKPVKAGVPITDIGAAMFAVYGILAGIVARERTGAGQHIDTSLLEAGISFEFWESLVYLFDGKTPEPTGSAHRLGAPYQAIQCSDGHITVGADGTRHWPLFCAVIGRDDLPSQDKYATNTERLENLDELIEEIERVTSQKPRAHWLAKLEDVGVPAGPINTLPEVFSNEQTVARNMVQEVDDHRVEGMRTIGPAVKFSRTPAAIRRTAPDLGQHTEEVLSELGITEDAIAKLKAEGIVS